MHRTAITSSSTSALSSSSPYFVGSFGCWDVCLKRLSLNSFLSKRSRRLTINAGRRRPAVIKIGIELSAKSAALSARNTNLQRSLVNNSMIFSPPFRSPVSTELERCYTIARFDGKFLLDCDRRDISDVIKQRIEYGLSISISTFNIDTFYRSRSRSCSRKFRL